MLKALPSGMRGRFIAYRLLRDFSMLPHYLRHRELRVMIGVWYEACVMRGVMRARRAELFAQATRSPRQMRAELRDFMRRGATR